MCIRDSCQHQVKTIAQFVYRGNLWAVGLGARQHHRQQPPVLRPLKVGRADLRLLLPGQNVVDMVDGSRMFQALAQEVLLQPRRAARVAAGVPSLLPPSTITTSSGGRV